MYSIFYWVYLKKRVCVCYFVGGNKKREEDKKMQFQDEFSSSPNSSAAEDETEPKGVITSASFFSVMFTLIKLTLIVMTLKYS